MAKPSRPARLRAIESELRALATEYQAWLDALPQNLAEGEMASKLEETVEVLENIAEEVWSLDPPCIGIRY